MIVIILSFYELLSIFRYKNCLFKQNYNITGLVKLPRDEIVN